MPLSVLIIEDQSTDAELTALRLQDDLRGYADTTLRIG